MSDLNFIKIASIIIALMVAIIGHEIMHGYVAYKYGDSTAKYQGRLSLNPIVHIDPVGSIVIPLLLFLANSPFLFGWAKPVPVNMHTVIKNGGYTAAIFVSLAGIAYNITLAVASAIVFSFFVGSGGVNLFFASIFYYLVIYNVVLAVFNLWPIPPLDGANAVSFFAMKIKMWAVAEFYEKIERYGMVLLIIVLATPLSHWFMQPAYFLIELLLK